MTGREIGAAIENSTFIACGDEGGKALDKKVGF
jgi:hypothetical protein